MAALPEGTGIYKVKSVGFAGEPFTVQRVVTIEGLVFFFHEQATQDFMAKVIYGEKPCTGQ